ncbi:hypothetical protein POTOM_059146 [Populus tomentosa]|uniref:Inositol 1,3,4-trisphosphate 5/6-kinase ATP-grasp domain-containing protein n=1 Tax=Populus tomentosa TaxID=118781 RepID=A0A8X7XP27_POPTO|nr:hypothetical protein POTOM_059146 [Populus tomentosa]
MLPSLILLIPSRDSMIGFRCFKSKSLPDIKEDKLVTLKGLLPFSQISNLEEKTDCGGGGEFDRVEMPPVDFVDEIPNYESVLTDFLLNSMEKNKSGDVSMVREHDDD